MEDDGKRKESKRISTCPLESRMVWVSRFAVSDTLVGMGMEISISLSKFPIVRQDSFVSETICTTKSHSLLLRPHSVPRRPSRFLFSGRSHSILNMEHSIIRKWSSSTKDSTLSRENDTEATSSSILSSIFHASSVRIRRSSMKDFSILSEARNSRNDGLILFLTSWNFYRIIFMFRKIGTKMLEWAFENIGSIPGFWRFIDAIPFERATLRHHAQFIIMNTTASAGILLLMFLTPVTIPVRLAWSYSEKVIDTIQHRMKVTF